MSKPLNKGLNDVKLGSILRKCGCTFRHVITLQLAKATCAIFHFVVLCFSDVLLQK